MGSERAVSETLAAFVRRNRQDRGWTQTQLAAKAGISQAFVSGIERGINARPEPDTLRSLASAFGVPYMLLMEAAGYTPDAAQAGAGLVEIRPGSTLVVTRRAGQRGTPLFVTEAVARLLVALAAAESAALADGEVIEATERRPGQVGEGIRLQEGPAAEQVALPGPPHINGNRL
jgi:DNA-binding XRE family transcriptional regulator